MASPSLIAAKPPDLFVQAPAKRPFARIDAVLLYGTFSLLLLGPLAFGAVEPWAIWLLETATASLFLLWALRQALSGQLQIAGNVLFAPMLAFAALIAAQIVFGLSAYRYETVSGAWLYGAYGLLALLAIQTLQRTAQVKVLAWGFSAYGLGISLFSLIQSLSFNGKLYWLRMPHSGGWIYGSYVNHNHYAGLMEMLFPIPLVIALSGHVRGYYKLVPAFASIVMASTIFLSGSRGGMTAFVVQVVVLGILLGRQKGRGAALSAATVLLVIAVLILWVGGEGVLGRVASVHSEARAELDGGLRLTVDRDGLRMFLKKPIFGWGLRSFPIVYPQYRSFFTNQFVNEAHNDYLQLLVETGIIGFACMIWFLVLVYRRALSKLNDWTWDINGAVGLAALLGCTGILVHSFVDFNLQVPANAALFYVLCAIAAAETKFGAHRRLRRRHRVHELKFQPISEEPAD